MELRQLEYFVRVAELGSFSRASRILDIAQPALSRQIRALEVELRQNLLVRNGRGVSLTDAGSLLLEHGRGILHQMARAREELGGGRQGLAGRVALGLPPSLTRVLAVPIIRGFRQRLPEARLAMTEGLTLTMQESLLTGRLDMAVLYNAVPTAGLVIEPLFEEDLVLVQARPRERSSGARSSSLQMSRTAISLPALAELPLVIPSQPNAIRMQVEQALAAHGLRPRIALEIDGVTAILEIVAEGLGSAVLTRNAVAHSLRAPQYRIRPLGKPRLRVQAWLAISDQRPTTATQQAALALVRALAPAVLGSAQPGDDSSGRPT